MLATGRVRPVAERHARLGAVVVELHTHDRRVGHADSRHRVGAHHDQLRLDELDDVVADRGLRFATALADRKSTRLNSSHSQISYAVFWLVYKLLGKKDL